MRRTRRAGRLGAAIILAAGALGAPAAGAGEEVGFYREVTFTRGSEEVDAVMRFRGGDRRRTTELFMALAGDELVALRVELALAPGLSSRTELATVDPEWSMVVTEVYSDLEAATFAAAMEKMGAGTPYTVTVRTPEGVLGESELALGDDQEESAQRALRGLVPGAEIVASVPAAARQRLVVAHEIVGPHGALPADWDFATGWNATGLVGPALRAELAAASEPAAWEAEAGEPVEEEALGEAASGLLARVRAAGLAGSS